MVAIEKGLTLIELLIVIFIIGLLLTLGVPYTSSWVAQANVDEALHSTRNAYSKAKALAMRNPLQVIPGGSESGVSAGIKRAGDLLLVCKGNPENADCKKDGDRVTWQVQLPTNVNISMNGGSITNIFFSSAGQHIDQSGEHKDSQIEISKGKGSYSGVLK